MQVSRDTLWKGQLVFWQPARAHGYRFNLDPILLADFAAPAPHIMDLGAGCGIVGILMLALGKAERVTAVEVQPELAELAQKNAAENGLAKNFTVVVGDLRELVLPVADAVVFNPPYFIAGQGQPAPHSGRDIARHERKGTLEDFCRAAEAQASLDGLHRFSTIVPWARREELLRWCSTPSHAIRERAVQPRQQSEPHHVLFEAEHSESATLSALPPLIVHQDQSREYSTEVAAMLRC